MEKEYYTAYARDSKENEWSLGLKYPTAEEALDFGNRYLDRTLVGSYRSSFTVVVYRHLVEEVLWSI